MNQLVLIRHGESQWNKENRFTGWVDVDLSLTGVEEARSAGRLLKKNGFKFDRTFTSVLKRAIRTHFLVLEELDQLWLPVERSWRLNERHYGSLQGLNKAETAAKYGDEQVHIWRRSYDTPPPKMERSSSMYAGNDPRYASLKESEIPLSESLKDTIARTLPFWETNIAPAVKSGQKVLVVAHGNSLRGLVKHLKKMSDAEIMELNIPTGTPYVFELESDFSVKKDYYLKDQG